MTLARRHVVLGVSGGIACYKSCTLARRLTEMGAAVDVILTSAAREFVGPVTFEALTQRTVLTSLWDRDTALAHVQLGHDADLIVVAPATANLIARAARGIADDLLTALLLARKAPVLIAPAMNDEMFSHPATQANLGTVRSWGWSIVGPDIGPLAEGDSDRPGRMSEPELIAIEAERMLRATTGRLTGMRVLVTAGPTREPLDPVRVVTNRSSGRMGCEVAAAAYSRGADVTLVLGPSSIVPPPGVTVVRVESTEEMRAAVGEQLGDTDLLVMAAAPADYQPTEYSQEKKHRGDGAYQVSMAPTTDVLSATRHLRKPGSVIVGFALESADGIERATAKLESKGLDLIALNMIGDEGAGFETDTNKVTLISRTEATAVPLLSKREVAEKLLDAAEQLL